MTERLITAANIRAAKKLADHTARRMKKCPATNAGVDQWGRLNARWERQQSEYESLLMEASDDVLLEVDTPLARKELARRQDGHAIIL